MRHRRHREALYSLNTPSRASTASSSGFNSAGSTACSQPPSARGEQETTADRRHLHNRHRGRGGNLMDGRR